MAATRSIFHSNICQRGDTVWAVTQTPRILGMPTGTRKRSRARHKRSIASARVTGALLVFTCLNLGCSDAGRDESGDDPYPTGCDPLVSLRIEPESGPIGTLVTIRPGPFVTPVNANTVFFEGASDYLLSDSGSQGVLFTFVPFDAASGPVVVRMGSTKGLTQPFQVTEAVDTQRTAVSWYDLPGPVRENDSSVVDMMGFRRTWTGELHGDTVHVHRGYSTGDEYYEYHFVMRHRGSGQLPELLQAWIHVRTDYAAVWDDTIRAGLLKVQDWDPGSVLSARFFGRPSLLRMRNGTVAFWVRRAG